tara:strand:- start:103 stop:387 length:285 start_codon:yes stop_codon:yes gene_type:complete
MHFKPAVTDNTSLSINPLLCIFSMSLISRIKPIARNSIRLESTGAGVVKWFTSRKKRNKGRKKGEQEGKKRKEKKRKEKKRRIYSPLKPMTKGG